MVVDANAAGSNPGNEMANPPYDIRTNQTHRAVLEMQDAMTAVANGEKTLTLIGGGTGLGKTYCARRTCRRAGIDIPEERPTTIEALVSFFWLNRERPVVLLDETDHLLRQEATCNLLKGANGTP